jgi:hypothetical protein
VSAERGERVHGLRPLQDEVRVVRGEGSLLVTFKFEVKPSSPSSTIDRQWSLAIRFLVNHVCDYLMAFSVEVSVGKCCRLWKCQ